VNAVNWHLWPFFVVTETVLCLTPGPAVLFVVSHGLTRGRAVALAANAGILTANALYFVLSALGLGAVLLASNAVFTALKYAGAAYLVYLGVQTIRGAGLSIGEPRITESDGGAALVWLRATALQASNPKALIFFTALLPQFVDTTLPVALQMIVLGLSSGVIEFCVLAAYGYLAARAAHVGRNARFVRAINYVSGGLLITAGATVVSRG
jgi:homoserine/homoserine lactone efflux protein